MPVLNAISLDFALPCLVLVVILKRFHPETMPGWHRFPAGWALFTLISLPLSLISGFAARKEIRREFVFCCFYQNALFFPLAILSELYGQDSKEVANHFLMTFLFPAFLFNTTSLFFQNSLQINWRKTLHPVLFMSAGGIILGLANLSKSVPNLIINALQQIGAMTVPLLMIALGARLRGDFEDRGPIYWREILAFIALRNIAFPVFFFALLLFFKIQKELSFLLILQAAMPPVNAAPAIVERNGRNAPFAGQILLAGYCASALTIPAAVWLWNAFFGK